LFKLFQPFELPEYSGLSVYLALKQVGRSQLLLILELELEVCDRGMKLIEV